MAKLIIISGAEATGKSHIRDELAKRLGIEYLSKDVIKEKMFDEGTVSTWRFSWYEDRANDELLRQTAVYLSENQSLIVEANFKAGYEARLRELLRPDTETYEIFCRSRGFASFRRFVKRNETGSRHPGHHDRRWYLPVLVYSICGILKINWPYKPMNLSQKILRLDTTDLSKIDYAAITQFISQPV